MFVQRHRLWAWGLIATVALTMPTTAHAQFLLGFGGNLFGSPVSGVPFGGWYGGYNNAPYRNYGGLSPYGSPNWAVPNTTYAMVPAYQPLYNVNPYMGGGSGTPYNGYPGATSYLGSYPGTSSTVYGPRMRATPFAGLGGTGIAPVGLGAGSGLMGRPGAFTGAPLVSTGVAPFACGMAGGGAWSSAALNYAAATVPPNYVAFYGQGRRGSSIAAAGVKFAGGAGPEDELSNTAAVNVIVPAADAEVWVEDVLMKLTGTTRQFISPPLNPGSRYAYTVRARWTQNGQIYSASRNIEVRAGNAVPVDFTRP